MSKIRVKVPSGIAILISLGIVTSFCYAVDPCMRSPEANNQGITPRCAESVCGLDCFQCPEILVAATACGSSDGGCSGTNSNSSCTQIKSVPASLNIGSLDSRGCPSGGANSWALKTTQGTAYLTVLCQSGNIQSIRNVVFADSKAKASGALCGWSYTPLSVVATWSEGKSPSLSIDGFSRDVIINNLAMTSNGTSLTLGGIAQAPLSGPTGYHSGAAISMTINASGTCSCT